MVNAQDKQIAILGGGCFWCLEAVYQDVEGVIRVESGYSGGSAENPTYQQVCSGSTGHAEVVKLTFDPHAISYREILEIFFSIHNPTTLNRQGADVGTQYRSAIFYQDQEQKQIAETVMQEIEAQQIWDDPLVTELAPFEKFYKAEDYHQNYYNKNHYQGYCQVVVAPKVAKFRKKFASRLKHGATA